MIQIKSDASLSLLDQQIREDLSQLERMSSSTRNRRTGTGERESEKWSRQRKLANYAFHGESLKNMTPAIIASVETMLEKWKGQEGKEIEVYQEFRLLASEIISRTAFGSSYLEGEKIFDILMKLSTIAGRNIYQTRIPIISEFWKSADEIESEKLAKTIHDIVMKMVFGNRNPDSEGISKLKTITMIINETLRFKSSSPKNLLSLSHDGASSKGTFPMQITFAPSSSPLQLRRVPLVVAVDGTESEESEQDSD
ncbi:hypothetical protein V6N13_105352 [Hibiscus sabdariffa]